MAERLVTNRSLRTPLSGTDFESRADRILEKECWVSGFDRPFHNSTAGIAHDRLHRRQIGFALERECDARRRRRHALVFDEADEPSDRVRVERRIVLDCVPRSGRVDIVPFAVRRDVRFRLD